MRRLKILHDAGGSIIRYRRAARVRSRVLVVTFTGFEGARNRRPGFAETALVEAGYDCIAVKMANCNNFNDISFEAMRKAVRRRARRYERVVTYGASGGGYAALYYSEAVGASLNLAISPRNTRDPRYARFAEVEMRQRTFAHRRLSDLPAKRALTIVIHDPLEPRDALYLREEVLPLGRCATIRFPFSHHPSTRVLGELGALKPILFAALDRVDDPEAAARAVADLVREAQLRRWSSPYFLTGMMMEAAVRGRAGLFDRLDRRVDFGALTLRAALRMRRAYRLMNRSGDFSRKLAAHFSENPGAKAAPRALEYDAANRQSWIAEAVDRLIERRRTGAHPIFERLPRPLRPTARRAAIAVGEVAARISARLGRSMESDEETAAEPATGVKPGGSDRRRRR